MMARRKQIGDSFQFKDRIMNLERQCDVTIIGGGPAGLSAALLLGRCLRRVIVCDEGRPRNESSRAMHGYLGLDGVNPKHFLESARRQLGRYETVSMIPTTIKKVRREDDGFVSIGSTGECIRSRVLLLATGLIDKLPDVPGLKDYYGISVHHCPYCDGWENRGKRIGVIGTDDHAAKLATELLRWSGSVVLFTNGDDLSVGVGDLKDITVIRGKIAELGGAEAKLSAVILSNSRRVEIDALFFSPHQIQHAAIAADLGCALKGESILSTGDCKTRIDGLFAAGNAAEGIQLAIVAAAEGAKAAAAINDWLTDHGRR